MNAIIAEAYEYALDVVGKVNVQEIGRISKRDFQRFAYAIGDLSPRYLDEEAARKEGFPDVVAPPIYLSGIMGWEAGPAEADLRRDGTGHSETVGLALDGLRLMGAGQELEFHHPVTDGVCVTAHVCLESVELKQGKSGPLMLLRILRRYLDQDGREMLICRESFIGR